MFCSSGLGWIGLGYCHILRVFFCFSMYDSVAYDTIDSLGTLGRIGYVG